LNPEHAQRRLAAILFTDMVGSTALMAESEQAALAAKQRHRTIVRGQVERHRGELIEAPGDETLSIFASALDAVSCALAIEDEAGSGLRLHLGIHSGDVLIEGGEIHGDGVNIAARICSLSAGGGLCVSGEVYQSVRNQPNVEAVPLGEHSLKNVGRPVAVYAIGRPGAVSMKAAPGARAGTGLRWAGIAVALAALAVLVWWGWSRPTASSAQIRSIAVLPFADMSPSSDQEYLGDGIAEEIMGGLSKVEALRVTARTSAFAFKGRNESIQTIGDQLGVGAVVEGSVRKAGDRLRITAQLIRVEDGFPLWSETYDRRLDDVFAIQDEIARATVAALKVQLTGKELLVEPQTGDVRAYEVYVTGRHLLNRRTEDDVRKAVGYFDQALEIDPSYVLAHVGLAESHILGLGVVYQDQHALSKAEAALGRALAIDPNSGEAQASLGFLRMLQWRWEEAETAFREAHRLDPAYAIASVWYAVMLRTQGRLEEAKLEIERALALDPLSPVISREAGRTYFRTGELVLAVEQFEKALELDPHYLWVRLLLVRARVALGQEPDVLGWFPGQDEAILGPAYAAGGLRGLMETALSLRIAETGMPCTERPDVAALTHMLLREVDRMYGCLEEAVAQKLPPAPIIISGDPAFAEIRSEPRFVAILRNMGIPD
jgi:TolB-like protein/class 3 adenylate cyclase/Tfp pilus assembly protein PilF